jgi:hypothetical protein
MSYFNGDEVMVVEIDPNEIMNEKEEYYEVTYNVIISPIYAADEHEAAKIFFDKLISYAQSEVQNKIGKISLTGNIKVNKNNDFLNQIFGLSKILSFNVSCIINIGGIKKYNKELRLLESVTYGGYVLYRRADTSETQRAYIKSKIVSYKKLMDDEANGSWIIGR